MSEKKEVVIGGRRMYFNFWILGVVILWRLNTVASIEVDKSKEEKRTYPAPQPKVKSFVPFGKGSRSYFEPKELLSRGYIGSSEYEYEMYPTSHGSYGRGFSPLAVVAVSVFGLLAFILLLQFLGVSIARSLTTNTFSLPMDLWNMSGEIIPELMVRAADWVEQNSKWTLGDETGTGDHVRGKRSTEESLGLLRWVRAYRKDPDTFSCLRKLVCETLANSTLAEKSVKSPLGETLMSVLGRAVERGSEVVDLVTEVVGDPKKCLYFASFEMC